MNPLYQQMNNQANIPNNNIIQRFQQFKNSFSGDPQKTVQELLNSGKVSQTQYDQAVRMANVFQQFLK